jgi:hypothetical protein
MRNPLFARLGFCVFALNFCTKKTCKHAKDVEASTIITQKRKNPKAQREQNFSRILECKSKEF